MYINDDKELFDKLYANKEKIEQELGLNLDWQRLNDKKASRIMYRIEGLNFDDHSNYDELMNRFSVIIDKLVKSYSEEDFQNKVSPLIVQITERYLGKGKKVSQCTRDQVEMLSLIVSELEDLKV